VFVRAAGVLRCEDSLDDHRQRTVGRELLDVAPRQARIDQGRELRRSHGSFGACGVGACDQLGGGPHAGAQIALPASHDRQIDGHHERLVALLDGGRDQLAADAAVREHVELEPAGGLRRAVRELGHARGGERRKAHDRPGGRRGARGADLPIGVRHPLKRHRRHEQWVRARLAEQGDARVALAHAHEHPRTDRQAAPRGEVVAERDLVARAAEVVAERAGLDQPFGSPLVVRERDQGSGWRGARFGHASKATEIALPFVHEDE
jgi:hypothetical protein